jgi:hypothetical protein
MDWRDTIMRYVSAGLLGGITLGDWLRLLRENRFAVSPAYLFRAMGITFCAAQNSVIRRCEDWRYRSRLKNLAVEPPIFLLGHWRHGTTHLHNLMTVDDRFAFPNMYQALFPHTFLSTEWIGSRFIGFFLSKRRPMDNVEWNMRSPQEEEFALCVASLQSPYMCWTFPRQRALYDKHLTMRHACEPDLARWRAAYILFLKKLTLKYQRPLVLKSPPSTCRIRMLLEMFPNARFVHIHRNPYAVFPSTRTTFQNTQNRLQHDGMGDLDDRIFRLYNEMYRVFFEERSLIPKGQFHEVSFERLEEDPVGQVKRIYEALGLPDFGCVEPALSKYVASIAGYEKNRFAELPADLRARIAREWRPCFEEWGYPV